LTRQKDKQSFDATKSQIELELKTFITMIVLSVCQKKTMHSNTLKLEDAAILIVDVQEAFRVSIRAFGKIAQNVSTLVQAAKLLSLPIIVTEQYPKGLGRTAEEIARVLPTDFDLIEKTAFSACGSAAFEEKLRILNRRQILVAGIEAHICVNQTVHDLLANNFQVHLLADCVAARTNANKKIAVSKMSQSGAILCSLEMALFEIMRDARHGEFRAIQKLIK
jgi:nicotinamidase-related amidase